MKKNKKLTLARIGKDSGKYVATIIFLVVILFPFFWILSTSLKGPDEVLSTPPTFIPKHITLINYKTAIETKNLLSYIRNSFIVTLSTVALAFALATPFAYVMSFLKFKLNKIYNTLFIAIQVLPVVTAIVPLFMIFKAMGIINTRFSMIIAYAASPWGIPIAIILLTGYLGEIPLELFQAAKIDGCSVPGIFFRIVLRLGLPGIITTCIYVFINVWQELLLVYRLLTKASLLTLPPGLQTFVGEHSTDWGGLMATSVVIAVPSVILFLVVQHYFIDNLAGSVKG